MINLTSTASFFPQLIERRSSIRKMLNVSGSGNAGGVRYLGSDLLCPLEADCDFKNFSLASDPVILLPFTTMFLRACCPFHLNATVFLIVINHRPTYSYRIVTNLV